MDASASTPLAEGQGQAQWIDVLASLREACALLRGPEHAAKPMLHTPEFSLHEAMSAVELFDPKMDPCTTHPTHVCSIYDAIRCRLCSGRPR